MKEFLQSKMVSRYGGRMMLCRAALLALTAILCTKGGRSNQGFVLDQSHELPGYSLKYLVGVINQPSQSEVEACFSLQEPTDVFVYGTAELDVDLVSVPERYLYKSDGIELFFQPGSDKTKTTKSFIYSVNHFRGEIDTNVNGVNFSGYYDHRQRRYLITIKVPWRCLNLKDPKEGDTILFNSSICDNDDGVKQKSKLVWFGPSDPVYDAHKRFGKLILSGHSSDLSPQTSSIHLLQVDIDEKIDWEAIQSSEIRNIAFGAINDTQDFSGKFKACWNSSHLLFSFQINDSQPKVATLDLKGSTRFHDFGRILTADGRDVWRMTVDNSSHAGGAAKNRKLDTILNLKAGNYKLKYVTDESHSWNNWDDRPPETPCYGIELYELIKIDR